MGRADRADGMVCAGFFLGAARGKERKKRVEWPKRKNKNLGWILTLSSGWVAGEEGAAALAHRGRSPGAPHPAPLPLGDKPLRARSLYLSLPWSLSLALVAVGWGGEAHVK